MFARFARRRGNRGIAIFLNDSAATPHAAQTSRHKDTGTDTWFAGGNQQTIRIGWPQKQAHVEESVLRRTLRLALLLLQHIAG